MSFDGAGGEGREAKRDRGDPNLLVSNLVNIRILRYKINARELDKPKTRTGRKARVTTQSPPPLF